MTILEQKKCLGIEVKYSYNLLTNILIHYMVGCSISKNTGEADVNFFGRFVKEKPIFQRRFWIRKTCLHHMC